MGRRFVARAFMPVSLQTETAELMFGWEYKQPSTIPLGRCGLGRGHFDEDEY